jgi:hypothetical protein
MRTLRFGLMIYAQWSLSATRADPARARGVVLRGESFTDAWRPRTVFLVRSLVISLVMGGEETSIKHGKSRIKPSGVVSVFQDLDEMFSNSARKR